MQRILCALGLLLLAAEVSVAGAVSLSPSRAAFERQVDAARSHGLRHARTVDDLYEMVENGDLVAVRPTADFELKEGTPWPYARPELKLFLERISVGYRRACGEKLVITSLTRPRNAQPRNASPDSVHPAGIAVDVRRSWNRSCRAWFDARLLDLEASGVVEAAQERRPPHYHLVVFPDPYLRYTGLTQEQAVEAVVRTDSESAPSRPTVVTNYRYVVQPGDSLWAIARRYDTDASAIQRANGLRSTRLRPGQHLQVPVGGPGETTRAPVYQVRRGDNLWRIARLHGTSPRALQTENGLRSSRIYPGQVLRIPLGGS